MNADAPSNWRNTLNEMRNALLGAYDSWSPSQMIRLQQRSNTGWSRQSFGTDRDLGQISFTLAWDLQDSDPVSIHQSVEGELKPALAQAFKDHFGSISWAVGHGYSWNDSVEIDGQTTSSFHRAKQRRGQGHINT